MFLMLLWTQKEKEKKKAFKFLNIGFERKMNLGDTFTFF